MNSTSSSGDDAAIKLSSDSVLENVSSTSDKIRDYEKRIAGLDEQIEGYSARWRSLSLVRGGLFLVALALVILGFNTFAGHRTLWFVAGGVLSVAFLLVAGFHEGLESKRREKQIWRRLYRWSLAKLNRDWDQLKTKSVEIDPKYAAISNDLDLFGTASLFQLVGGVETPSGIGLFRDWILGVPTSDEIRRRQESVSELKNNEAFCYRFRFLCHRLSIGDSGPNSLVEWAEAEVDYDASGIRKNVAVVLTVGMVVALICMLTGFVGLPIIGPVVLALLAINFMWTVFFAGGIHTVFNQVSTRLNQISHYNAAFREIRETDFEGKRLTELKNELFNSDSDVLSVIKHLGAIAWRSNWRRHGFLFPVYVLFQFAFLWDFHTIRQLQNWKKAHGKDVKRWFEILGELEVLAALGQFAADHADWPHPEIYPEDKTEKKIECQNLGHPLLHHEQRVNNDVAIGPEGTVLLVTGSNMSGKSTLLRSLALNIVLAHLGAPVCAKKMSLSPMQIETSMRIQDSLADGVSFFMAELKRLKQVVDIARQNEDNKSSTVLFLLDEILQGTNSQERHIAVTRVIRHLIDHKAIGAVSTHDLELGKSGELADACQLVHFRESFDTVDGKKVMTFDYQIHDGIATTTNALKLLELVGLIED